MQPPSPSIASPTLWHSESIEGALSRLHTSGAGLSTDEAKKRLAAAGPNKLPEEKRKSLLFVFLGQFQSPLIYLLLVADVTVFILHEFVDAYIILFILLFNALLGTIQEGKAARTLAALKRFTETDADVMRDGKKMTLPDKEVVPGDIILLQEGEKIPADARIIEAHNLKLAEAALTGESTPVRKTVDALPAWSLPTSEMRNMVFKGTSIAVGYGKAVVVATGLGTMIGGISKRIAEIDTEIPLTKNLRDLARTVVIIVAILVLIFFAIGVFEGKAPKEMFIAAVAIAVAAVPEGLPLVLTVVLAAGVWKMAKKRVLVKKLQAVEALGQADVIAVDKTGTITKNELTIRSVVMSDGEYAIEGRGYETQPKIQNPSPHLLLAAQIASLCSNAHLSLASDGSGYRVVGDPTEGAMDVFAEKTGIQKEELLKEYLLIDEWPFDYEKKYHLALHREQGVPFLAATGAPEVILSRASHALHGEKEMPLEGDLRKNLESKFLALSEKGMRVIAFAYKRNAPEKIDQANPPPLTFGGFYVMQDPLREHIAEYIVKAKDAGLRIIMITGDHIVTAEAIAREAGILNEGEKGMTGEEMDALFADDRDSRILAASVFARVTPEHKVKIIEAYRRAKQVIAMTGDGVNDAPSLVAADLGIAMGKIGTEVTKEAADLILMDDNFGDILAAIEEGRNLRQGIKRSISYLFSSNAGELLVIATALLLGMPLPLLAGQIIWMNLVTDTFFDISLALEPHDPAFMKKGVMSNKLLGGAMGARFLTIAPLMAIGTLWLFFMHRDSLDEARTVALTALVIFQWFNAWNCRSERTSVFKLNPFSNKFLLSTLAWVAILHMLALYTPLLNRILRTTPLSPGEFLPIFLIGFGILLADEIRKLVARRMGRST